MALAWLGQVAPAVVSLGGAAFGLARGQGKLRRNIRYDIDTISKLPSDLAAQTGLAAHIEWQVSELANREQHGSRDWSTAIMAFIVTAALGYLAVWLFSHDALWRWTGVIPSVIVIAGIYSMVDTLTVKPREDTKDAGKGS